MAEKNLNIAYYNGVWVLLEGLTVHKLGTKYQICGNFVIGTNQDGTMFAICVGGKKYRKYGVFTKFFLVDDNRLAALEIDSKWKLYTPAEKILLGSMIDEEHKFFIYSSSDKVKFSKIDGHRLVTLWCRGYQRGLRKSITLRYPDGMSELIAV